MNQAYKLFRISQLLSRFKEQVQILNSNGEFSINIHAENILIKVLNQILNADLKNVNYEERKNYPAIDLRDVTGRIAVQVTSSANLEKVKQTLTKFIDFNEYKNYDYLYIYILSEKHKKYDEGKLSNIVNGLFPFGSEYILDRSDIYKILNALNDETKIDIVCEYLENQFADKVLLSKWNLYCKGLNEYDQFIQNFYRYLDIKGFSARINNTLVKIGLEHLYVPLELRLEDMPRDPDKMESKGKILSVSIQKALNDFSRLVILGNPGSGKSTLLKHIAYMICKNRPTMIQFSELVPVLIKSSEFAKYVATSSKNLTEYIIDHIDKKYEQLFAQKLDQNELLVLVDGIDEINITSLRHSVVERVNAFVAQYPKAKIIISSRIVGYNETRLSGHFQHLQINNFKKPQIEKFVFNWYQSLASNSEGDLDNAKKDANNLFESIKRNYSVLNMASNPLLITIIALIHHQGGVLPEKRAALYEAATSTFLENWVRQREGSRASVFDKETLIAILAPISYFIHQKYTTGLITESKLKTLFQEEYKKLYPYQRPKEETQDLRELLNFLREDAGFLFEKGINDEGEPVFGFVHQTFQEYFAAIEFKTRWIEGVDDEDFKQFVLNSNWNEVIKLTASLFKFSEPGRLGRQYATKFVRRVLNVDDPFPELCRPLSLVVQILADDTETEFELFQTILQFILDGISREDEEMGEGISGSKFRGFLEGLLESKYYQRPTLEKIITLIQDDTAPRLTKYLIFTLMDVADTPSVHEILSDILKKGSLSHKKHMFDYNVVYPVSEIVFSEIFRNKIVEYVNSDDFVSNYTHHLPSQYHCAFEREKKNNLRFENFEFNEKARKERLLSIQSIKDEKVRYDYINFQVFSVGISDLDELTTYYTAVKNLYPEISLPRIEEKISELTSFKSLGLQDYEIFEFKSTKIYAKRNSEPEFSFFKENKYQSFSYPFNKLEMVDFFDDETETYVDFLNFILNSIQTSSRPYSLQVDNVTSMINFIRYEKTVNFRYHFNLENAAGFALAILFDIGDEEFQILFNWLKNRGHFVGRINPDQIVDRNLWTLQVQNSLKLNNYQKLFLLSKVLDREELSEYIQLSIEDFKTEKSTAKRNEIKEVLYSLL